MKSVFLLIAIVIGICFTTLVHAQPVIVDHTCTDVRQIPIAWIQEAKNNLRIFYAHSSHGIQLVTGINAIRDTKGNDYDFSYAETRFVPGVFLFDTQFLGDLGEPDRTSWAARTRELLQGVGDDRNVVMWSWCRQVANATEADINTYLSLMNQLERDFPHVRFVYMTGTLDGSGINGNLNIRNEQIRNYARNNDKILFDFADIESYDPDGLTNYMVLCGEGGCIYDPEPPRCNPWVGRNWALDWIDANPDSELTLIAQQCGSCAHSVELNCVLKGGAFWWLMARLAGWDGGIIPQYTLTVTKAGSGKGTVRAAGLTCGASTCRGNYSEGEVVTVTAQAQTGSYFDGWTGCDGTNGDVCTMTMDTAKNATVTFKQLPAISVKPKSLNLGKVKRSASSEAKTITVTNKGDEDIVVDSADITGTNWADFQVVNGCTSALPPDASCAISVTTVALDYGKRQALLHLVSNAKTPVVNVKLKAKAEKPKISAGPGTLNFGKVSIAASPPPTKTITVKNNGLSDLVISSVALVNNANNEFTHSTACSTLGKGETCAIEVTFAPTSSIPRTAQVEIQSNDPNKSPLYLKLKGQGQ